MHSVSYFKTYFQIFQTALNCKNNLQLYKYHFPLSGHFYLLFLCIICQYADFYTFLIKQSWIFCFTLYNKCCQKDWCYLWRGNRLLSILHFCVVLSSYSVIMSKYCSIFVLLFYWLFPMFLLWYVYVNVYVNNIIIQK